MSTLRAINLQHPSSATVNATLTSGGNLTGAGMDLVVRQDYSSVASVSVNNCFSSLYENYRIIVSYYQNATSSSLLRWRAGGVDAATTYDLANYFVRTAGTSVVGATNNGTGQTAIMPIFATAAASTYLVGDVLRPAIASTTLYFGKSWSTDASGQFDLTTSAMHQQNTAYDGFSLIAQSGLISGTIRVYGLRNA